MAQQIPLDLESPDRFSRDNFVAEGELREILAVVMTPQTWLSPYLILFGSAGSGKTHLGHIFAESTNARFFSATDTHNLDVASQPPQSFVVDDAEQASEDALFHLFNSVQSSGQYLVLLTNTQPLQWRTTLPDLASRLGAMRLITLPEPNDAQLEAILYKLFTQRAISPSPDSLAYIASRMDRSVTAAQKIVTDLEHYANGRPFNRALARDFFEQSDRLPFGKSDTESESGF